MIAVPAERGVVREQKERLRPTPGDGPRVFAGGEEKIVGNI
jgi:hypothetical protein